MRRHRKPKFRWVMPAFIVFIMVFSVFAIMLRGDSGISTKYNGHKVKPIQDGYEITAGNIKIYTGYHPEQMEDLNVAVINQYDLLGKKAVLAFDPNQSNPQYSDYARFQLAKFFEELGIKSSSGVTIENSTMPYVNCDTLDENSFAVLFLEGNETKITIKENCYTLEAAYPQEMIRVENRFKLAISGVMNSSVE